jgi:hypothetical protein
MNDTYVYLMMGVGFLLPVVVITTLRPDLLKLILKVGVLGGITGLIVEYWYFRDYWRPPSLFGIAVPSVEDFIVGFSLAAIASTFFLVINKQKQPIGEGKFLRRFVPLAVTALVGMFILIDIIGINSGISTYVVLSGFAVFILIQKPFLWKKSLITASFLIVLSLGVYAVLFGVLEPNYIDTYFLVIQHAWNPTLFGFFPLSELLWYATCGLSTSLIYDYVVDVQGPSASKLQA